MARALDAGSDDAFTCRTSELRGKETDPQPDRVGIKQDHCNLELLVVICCSITLVLQTHCRPRPELDIDLFPAHLSPGNSEAGARPVG